MRCTYVNIILSSNCLTKYSIYILFSIRTFSKELKPEIWWKIKKKKNKAEPEVLLQNVFWKVMQKLSTNK